MSWVISITAVPCSRHSREQRDDLRLDRDIERGGRLVGDDELRVRGQGQRDHHALPHAAGELVRILVEATLGGRDAHLGKQLQSALPCGFGRELEVRRNRLNDLAPDGVERVQRGQRILEHGADLATANAAHRLG
jgi:hypothetical protein